MSGPVRGEHRCGDDYLRRRSVVEHRQVVQHRGEDLVDAGCRESGAALRDVPGEVVRPMTSTDATRACIRFWPARAATAFTSPGEARVRQYCLGAQREVSEAGDVVGDVLLAASDPVAVDRDLAPGLRVDDEDQARPTTTWSTCAVRLPGQQRSASMWCRGRRAGRGCGRSHSRCGAPSRSGQRAARRRRHVGGVRVRGCAGDAPRPLRILRPSSWCWSSAPLIMPGASGVEPSS